MVTSGPAGDRRFSTDGEASRKRCERRLTSDAKSPEPPVREPNKKAQRENADHADATRRYHKCTVTNHSKARSDITRPCTQGISKRRKQPRPNLRSKADKKTRTNAKGPTELTVVTYVSIEAVVAAVVIIVGLKKQKGDG